MPRKRTAGPARIGDLSLAMVDVVLTGDSELDPFLVFEVTGEQIQEAWRLHGPELRAEAKRRRGLLHDDSAKGQASACKSG